MLIGSSSRDPPHDLRAADCDKAAIAFLRRAPTTNPASGIAARKGRDARRGSTRNAQEPGRVRRIEPHALGYDGFRWHARARDAEDGAFKDYVLGRLSGATLLGPAEAPSSTDQDWHGWVTLTIAPNPGLSPAQKKVIERDYGMRGGTADLKVRKALAYYTKHRLGLDLDPKARRPVLVLSTADCKTQILTRRKVPTRRAWPQEQLPQLFVVSLRAL